MADTKQNIEGNNNNQTFIDKAIFIGKEGYESFLENEAADLGVINSIFNFVLINVRTKQDINNSRADKLLNTTQKIKINFKSLQEREEVTNFCKFASDKIALIEKAFSELDPDDQNDVHSFILGKYSLNRTQGQNNMTNFYSLCNEFISPNMRNNPKYQNIAKSFVLFFFQDCTIFEKTIVEKSTDTDSRQLTFDF